MEACEGRDLVEEFSIDADDGSNPSEGRGASGSRRLKLHTCTPQYHNRQCHSTQQGFGSGEKACSTGLRVYEGARLMSSFLRSDTFRRSTVGQKLFGGANDVRACVVELGCGCGLSGLTLASTTTSAHVVLTDASAECVALVRASLDSNRELISGGDFQTLTHSVALSERGAAPPARIVDARVLWWKEDEVQQLRTLMGESAPGFTTFDLVVGTDLLYFLVDPLVLLSICRELSAASNGGSGWILLAHFMRIPNGQKVLREAAEACGLRMASVDTKCVLPGGAEALWKLGWSDLELVVLRARGVGPVASEGGDDTATLSAEFGVDLLPYPCSSSSSTTEAESDPFCNLIL